jgi:hypothetical protein
VRSCPLVEKKNSSFSKRISQKFARSKTMAKKNDFYAKIFYDKTCPVFSGQGEEQERAAAKEDAAARFSAVGTVIFSNRL